VPAGPLPDVPALVIAGREAMRTPQSDSHAVARAFPRGQFVLAQHSGHSVATSEGSECAEAALARFLAGKRAAACHPMRLVEPPPIPRLTPPRHRFGYGTRIDRTLSAFADTLGEVLDVAPLVYNATGGL